MGYPTHHWSITFTLTPELEMTKASVFHVDTKGRREIIDMSLGPFDSPEDILGTLMELIDHAEWRGEQLKLPATVPEE